MKTFIFGEAMLEYHGHGGSGLRFGGDTLNTAVHMARRGYDVAFVTAVGVDPISDALVAAWQAEGIDTAHVHRHPDRSPGIYAIHLDERGERSFLYWRDRSAAREMFEMPGMEESLNRAGECELVYFSLITLAIIGDRGREQLLNLAHQRKAAGLHVAYDSNFRPALWPDLALAREVSTRAMRSATIGLPTDVDERQLHGARQSEVDIADRWHEAGCEEVVVKAGERGCVLKSGSRPCRYYPASCVEVVDSSGAGDAFNAGFLASRLSGTSASDAIAAGQALAAETIGHHGAIRL